MKNRSSGSVSSKTDSPPLNSPWRYLSIALETFIRFLTSERKRHRLLPHPPPTHSLSFRSIGFNRNLIDPNHLAWLGCHSISCVFLWFFISHFLGWPIRNTTRTHGVTITKTYKRQKIHTQTHKHILTNHRIELRRMHIVTVTSTSKAQKRRKFIKIYVQYKGLVGHRYYFPLFFFLAKNNRLNQFSACATHFTHSVSLSHAHKQQTPDSIFLFLDIFPFSFCLATGVFLGGNQFRFFADFLYSFSAGLFFHFILEKKTNHKIVNFLTNLYSHSVVLQQNRVLFAIM